MGRGAGLCLFLARGASLLLVRHLSFTPDGHRGPWAANQENSLGTGGEHPPLPSSAHRSGGVRLRRQSLRGKAEFRHRQRLLTGRIQNLRHVGGGGEGKILGGVRRHLEGVDSGGFLPQRQILPDREWLAVSEACSKADAAHMGGGVRRRDLDQGRETRIPHYG